MIVPWAAGGSTDQVTRVAAAEIEKALGQKVVVVNQPGASGSIGTRNAMQAPRRRLHLDGRRRQGSRHLRGQRLLDTKITDWRLYLSVVNVSVLGVNPNTPYKTAQDVVDAMKAKPGQVSVATAGINSSGHAAIEAFTRALGLTYKHVSYDGGNPAVIATVAGETEMTTQLAVEQAKMIRGKRLRALAVLSDKPLELEGFGTDSADHRRRCPASSPTPTISASSCRRAFPSRCSRRSTWCGTNVIMKSEALKKYATTNGALFAPVLRRRRR